CVGSLSSPSNPASAVNRSPVVNCDNLIGANGKEFVGYINGYDPDGDYLSWGLFPQNIPWTNWASSTAPLSWGPASVKNYQRVYSVKAGDKGVYSFKAIVSDTKGGRASTTCKITIGGYCGDGAWDSATEGCDTNDNVAATSAGSSETKQYGCTDECENTGGWCGDAFLQDNKGEKCDGVTNIATTSDKSNINKQYGCTAICGWTGGYCGDTIIQDGTNGTISAGEQCDATEGLADWRCVGLGDLLCQNCQRKCSKAEGKLAQCGTGTARLYGEITDEVLSTKKIFNGLVEVKDSGGKLIASTTTDVDGKYNFSSLQKSFCQAPCQTPTLCGYKMTVSKTGYQNKDVDALAFDDDLEKNLALTPSPLATGTRIILKWGAEPADLDAHLEFEAMGETIDICYGDMGVYNGASIDTDGGGEETITINAFIAGSTYKYYVHNYSGTANFSSMPVVQIVDSSSNVLYEFSPASSFSKYWYLFDFDVNTGRLILKNGLNGEVSDNEVLKFIVNNNATGRSCSAICNDQHATCISIGNNATADNGLVTMTEWWDKSCTNYFTTQNWSYAMSCDFEMTECTNNWAPIVWNIFSCNCACGGYQ
ncbi:MAG: hypothetical protein C0412_18720, partial [Flavobacterium sp.]|nr:hypothetical protein [Flavobacterium sp.]